MAAEAWLGAAQGARTRSASTSATRSTPALILDGKPWTGAHDRAGAAAWLALNPVERQDYRRLGSLAAEVSAGGIARRLSWRIQAGDHSQVLERGRRIARRHHRASSCSTARAPATASPFRSSATPRSTSAWRSRRSPPRSIPRSIIVERQRRRGGSDARAGPAGVRAPAAARRDDRSARRVLDARRRRGRDRRGAARHAGTSRMIRLSGADLVLPDRVARRRHARDRRRSDRRGRRSPGDSRELPGDRISTFRDHYIVPGFIDVHVHGSRGSTRSTAAAAIAAIAERLPRYGVTAFCPTSLACDPPTLRRMLAGVRLARTTRPPGGARVLPAHLESNFINPDYKGAQPRPACACPRSRASDASDVAKAVRGPATTSSPRSPRRGRTSGSSRSRRNSTARSI